MLPIQAVLSFVWKQNKIIVEKSRKKMPKKKPLAHWHFFYFSKYMCCACTTTAEQKQQQITLLLKAKHFFFFYEKVKNDHKKTWALRIIRWTAVFVQKTGAHTDSNTPAIYKYNINYNIKHKQPARWQYRVSSYIFVYAMVTRIFFYLLEC